MLLKTGATSFPNEHHMSKNVVMEKSIESHDEYQSEKEVEKQHNHEPKLAVPSFRSENSFTRGSPLPFIATFP